MQRLEGQNENVALQLCNDMKLPDPNDVAYSDSERLLQAHPKWKDHPDYMISQNYLPDIDGVSDIDHHFAIILLKSLKKSLDK
jgi:hypothetical protein